MPGRFLLLACVQSPPTTVDGPKPAPFDSAAAPSDADGDGVTDNADCDDADDAVSTPTLWYPDADADGFGDLTTATSAWGPDRLRGRRRRLR